MINRKYFVIGAVFLSVFSLLTATQVPGAGQQFVNLGDFKLETGGVIRNCVVGYRTFGKLNAERSNVVVYLMWAGGRTEQLHLQPSDAGKLLDTEKYFVVAIDPLSNGVSSSPSNSVEQSHMKFPKYTMRDLINTQYELLTKKLGFSRVKAIIGASMGGMQTFQWVVSYPGFAESAIPIVGSPQLAPYDLVHWRAQIDGIMNDVMWKNGDYTTSPARVAEYEFGAILLTTPEEFNRKMTREKVMAAMEKGESNTSFDANNKIRQVQAMMSIDVTDTFDHSWEKAASAVRTRMLIVAAKQDHVVTPEPALTFARLINARTLILEGNCGHMAPSCEADKVNAAVADFLK